MRDTRKNTCTSTTLNTTEKIVKIEIITMVMMMMMIIILIVVV